MLSATGVILIGINQVRVDPGVMYGNPETSPGGRAWRHACSIMLNFAMINNKDSKIFDEEGEQTGHHVRVRVDKNRLAPPYRVAEIAIKYTQGIAEKEIEIRELGAKYDVIERPNNKTWILDDEKYNGKDAMAEALLDEELQLSVFERIKEAKENIKSSEKVEEIEEIEIEE